MNSSWKSFEKQIDEIKDHIKTLEDSQTLINEAKSVEALPVEVTIPLNRIDSRRNLEKTYEYRANVVSLYGAFEHFVEELIKEYVGELSAKCNRFQDLDDRIRKEYVERWKSLHTNVKKGHTKYPLDEFKMAKNMHDTLVGDSSNIMAECYIPIGGNYRHGAICEIMEGLGAINIKSNLKKYEPLKGYMNSQGYGDDVADMVLFHEIENLVERRNEVAHGGSDNLLGDNEFDTMMNFVSIYAETLNNYMNDELYRVEWEKTKESAERSIDHRFLDGMVAVLTIANQTIRKGNKYIVKWPDGMYPRYMKMTIGEMHREEADGTAPQVDEVVATENVVISIQVEKPVTDGCIFKFL